MSDMWTVRGVPAAARELAKRAAKAEGMVQGAWVGRAIEKAAAVEAARRVGGQKNSGKTGSEGGSGFALATVVDPAQEPMKLRDMEPGKIYRVPAEEPVAITDAGRVVDLKRCRKEQGVAEEGNSCLQTPGTCESCPNYEKAPSVVESSGAIRTPVLPLKKSGGKAKELERVGKAAKRKTRKCTHGVAAGIHCWRCGGSAAAK